jgi:hypothetical protein
MALYVFRKENLEYKIIEPAFFIFAIFISILSARLQIIWPSAFTLCFAVILHHFDMIKNAVNLSADDNKTFFIYSFEILMVISVFPAVFDTYLFFALIIAFLMLFVIVAPFTGFSGIISQFLPEIPEKYKNTYFTPSFFVIVYLLCIVFCIPSFIIGLSVLAFLTFHINFKSIKTAK